MKNISPQTHDLVKRVKRRIGKDETTYSFSKNNGLDASHMVKIFRGDTLPTLDVFVKLCAAAGLEIRLTEIKKK